MVRCFVLPLYCWVEPFFLCRWPASHVVAERVVLEESPDKSAVIQTMHFLVYFTGFAKPEWVTELSPKLRKEWMEQQQFTLAHTSN